MDDADLLDFSRSSAGVRTPGTDGTTRASWVAEMNAELAEFDALTSTVTPEGRAPAGGTGGESEQRWKQSLEQELSQHLR